MFRISIFTILMCLAFSCGNDNTTSSVAPLTYGPPTESEARAVETMIDSRDRSAKNVEMVYQKLLANNREVRVYKHRVENNDHYGSIILPADMTREKIPVVIIASGRNSDPTLFTILWMSWAEVVNPDFNNMILILPSFRSRELAYADQSFQSTGDPCDAFDGSTDDTIALLNVVLNQIPQADEDKIILVGASRGGTIAHLAGQRDNRIDLIITISGPVDFNRAQFKGNPFFDCSFLQNRTPTESRMKILACSPLFFAHRSVPTRIHHGIHDPNVPIWNADEMYQALLNANVDVKYTKYDAGHGLATVPEFQENVRKEVAEFLNTN